MNIFEMNAAGSVLIIVILIIRALLLNRIPKMTFRILWLIVALRLLIPVSISSPVNFRNIYAVAKGGIEKQMMGDIAEASTVKITPTPVQNVVEQGIAFLQEFPQNPVEAQKQFSAMHILQTVWASGLALVLILFVVAYFHNRIRFRVALLANKESYEAWYQPNHCVAKYRLKYPIKLFLH